MRIKLIREIDTEKMYRSMMYNIFKHPYHYPYHLISDAAILNEFENEWKSETHTEMCETLTLEETIDILHEFKGYVKNHLFENNC